MQNKHDCPVCWESFNNSNRLPRVLPSCGHTICAYCLNKILEESEPRCPLDKHELSSTERQSVPINLLARDLLKGRMSWAQCEVHKEKKKYFCEDENKSVCSQCAVFGGCKNHKLKLVVDFKPLFDAKKEEFVKISESFRQQCSEILQLIEERQKVFEKTIEEFPSKEITDIDVKLYELSLELESFFTKEVDSFKNTLGNDSSFSNLIIAERDRLVNYAQTDNFLDLLKQDVLPHQVKMNSLVSDFQQPSEQRLFLISTALDQILKELSSPAETDQTLTKWFAEQEQKGEKPSYIDSLSFSPLKLTSNFDIRVYSQVISLRRRSYSETSKELNLAELENITDISFDLGSFNLTEKSLLVLKFLHKKLKKLTKITIDCAKQGACEFEKTFLHFFPNPAAIENITLLFNDTEFSDSHCTLLFSQPLSKMRNLSFFKIDLEGTAITCEGISQLVEHVLPNLKDLDTFHLIISRTKAKEDAVLNLIKNLPDAKNLLLGLGELPVTDREMSALAEVLKNSKNLQFCELGLYETSLADAGVKVILESIPEGIKNLRLGLRTIEVAKETLRKFLDEKVPTLALLENLEMKLEDKSIHDEVVELNSKLKSKRENRDPPDFMDL